LFLIGCGYPIKVKPLLFWGGFFIDLNEYIVLLFFKGFIFKLKLKYK